MISFCGFLESSLDFQYVCKSASKSYVLHNACKNIHIHSWNVSANKSPIRHRPLGYGGRVLCMWNDGLYTLLCRTSQEA